MDSFFGQCHHAELLDDDGVDVYLAFFEGQGLAVRRGGRDLRRCIQAQFNKLVYRGQDQAATGRGAAQSHRLCRSVGKQALPHSDHIIDRSREWMIRWHAVVDGYHREPQAMRNHNGFISAGESITEHIGTAMHVDEQAIHMRWMDLARGHGADGHTSNLTLRSRHRPTLGKLLRALAASGVHRRDQLIPFLRRRKGGSLNVLRYIRLWPAGD